MKIKRSEFEFVLFMLLIAIMPLHYLLFSLILDNISILSLWRDGIIIILTISTLSRKGGVKSDLYTRLIIVIIVMIAFFITVNLSTNTANLARTYIIPILIYFYTSEVILSNKHLNLIFKTLLFVGAMESIYGLFQAFVLGSQFLLNLGYSGINGRLASSSFYISGFWTRQRVVGTFVSPNNCGCFLAIVIILSWTMRDRVLISSRLFYILIACNLAGLVGTFSRSAWLGTFLGIVLLNRWKKIKIKPSAVIYFLLGVLLFLLIDNRFLDGKVIEMFTTHVFNTLQGESSSRAHFRHFFEPIINVLEHPFGLGFGTNGSFAISYLPIDDVHLVESSIYLMMYEVGLFGAFIFFLPYILRIFRYNTNPISRCSAKISLCLMCVYMFLPSIQAYEQPFYFWMILGLSVNKDVVNVLKGSYSLKKS